MAFLLDEKKLINENIFMHEERMSSQYSRYLEKSPTFVTYYNINNIESTVDLGFQNIERVLGDASPLKYKRISDLPLYISDQILLDLNDEEQGLDTSYEGDGIILPNTIKPLPNDFFIINYLNHTYLFMITQISYDTIKSNSFYKVSFTLKSVDDQSLVDLESQTNEKYHCILTNIGTKEKCLIKEDEVDLLIALNKIYTDIAERYKMFFMNNRYNSFMYTDPTGLKIFDNYLAHFINQFELFNEKNNFETILLNEEPMTPQFIQKYHDSVYRALEVNKKSLIRDDTYSLDLVTNFTSPFYLYRDVLVRNVTLGNGAVYFYFPTGLIPAIQSGEILDEYNIQWATIIDHFNNKITTIYELNLEKLSDYNVFMDYSFETYILAPILLFILRMQYNKFMSTV